MANTTICLQYTGPTCADGLPDMESPEWEDYCSLTWWEAVREAEAISEAMRENNDESLEGKA